MIDSHCTGLCSRLYSATSADCIQLCRTYAAVRSKMAAALPVSCRSACRDLLSACATSDCLLGTTDAVDDDRTGHVSNNMADESPSAFRPIWQMADESDRKQSQSSKRSYVDVLDVCMAYHCADKLEGTFEYIQCAIENHCNVM